jgi:thioredoxin reductase (NADPH)
VELVGAARVASLAPDGTEAGDVSVRLTNGQELVAHAVLLATGSTYRRLGVPGEDALIGAGVHFCATCDGPFYRGAEEILVVGGGNSALEEAMFLSQFARRVRIAQLGPALTASALLQAKVLSDPRFVVHTNVKVERLEGGKHVEAVVARDLGDGAELIWHPAAVFVFIGLDPNTSFVAGALELDQWGFVDTTGTYETSMPGVFAAGDARAGSTKQLASAVGEGVAALLSVRRFLQEHLHLMKVDVND